jgi:phage terminase large subunit-like protein
MPTAKTTKPPKKVAAKKLAPKAPWHKYAEEVADGTIVACKWVRLACERHLRDLKKSETKSFPYRFDEVKAGNICRFLELMPHIKGPKAGEHIVLEAWQKFILGMVFGWVRKDSGLRRFRHAYIEVPRGNAKSTKSAGVGLYLFAVEGEGGAEVYSAATTRDQAKIVFEVAQQMTRKSPGFKKKFGVQVNARNISQLSTASKFEPLSSDAGTLDGLNVYGGIIDELHAHKTRSAYDVIETGAGKREQSLIWCITTAGSNRAGICYEQRDYVIKVLEKTSKDETYFGIIYTIDDDDDWTDPEIWKKANPNWDVSVMPDHVANLARKALQMPSAQNNFKTKHLNVWVNASSPWMDMMKWAKCCDKEMQIEHFHNQECIEGLDLASRIDIAAKAKLFWKDIARELVENGQKRSVLERHYYAFLDYYLNEEAIESSRNSQYSGWSNAGLLIETSGDETDYGRIADDVMAELPNFKIREIAYDPWQAPPLIQVIQNRADWDRSIELVEIKPSVQNFSPAMKELEGAVAGGRFHHNGDPILAWMISNVVCHRDNKDNIFPRKEREENKIDGAVALLMAINRAMVADAGGSIYDLIGPENSFAL